MALGPAKIGAPAGIELGFGVDPLRIERECRRRIGRPDLAQATPLHRALERRDESRIGRHAFECERRSRAHQGIGKRRGGLVIGAQHVARLTDFGRTDELQARHQTAAAAQRRDGGEIGTAAQGEHAQTAQGREKTRGRAVECVMRCRQRRSSFQRLPLGSERIETGFAVHPLRHPLTRCPIVHSSLPGTQRVFNPKLESGATDHPPFHAAAIRRQRFLVAMLARHHVVDLLAVARIHLDGQRVADQSWACMLSAECVIESGLVVIDPATPDEVVQITDRVLTGA